MSEGNCFFPCYSLQKKYPPYMCYTCALLAPCQSLIKNLENVCCIHPASKTTHLRNGKQIQKWNKRKTGNWFVMIACVLPIIFPPLPFGYLFVLQKCNFFSCWMACPIYVSYPCESWMLDAILFSYQHLNDTACNFCPWVHEVSQTSRPR